MEGEETEINGRKEPRLREKKRERRKESRKWVSHLSLFGLVLMTNNQEFVLRAFRGISESRA